MQHWSWIVRKEPVYKQKIQKYTGKTVQLCQVS